MLIRIPNHTIQKEAHHGRYPSPTKSRRQATVPRPHGRAPYCPICGNDRPLIEHAASVLINEGWNAAVEQRHTEPRNYVAPTESESRKAVAYYLDANLIAEIKRLALAENNTASQIVSNMIRSALAARAAQSKASA